MKKFMALLMAMVMLLSFTPVMAAEDDVLAGFEQAMLTQYNNGNVKMNLSLTAGGAVFELDEDLMMIKEVIDNLGISYDLNIISNEEQTKLQSSGTMAITAELLSELLIAAEGVEAGENSDTLTYDVWLDMDISDMENPKYYVITKEPVDGQYLIVDMGGDLLGEALMQVQSMGLLDTEKAAELSEKLYSGIEMNVDFADGKYTLTMTDAEIKAAIGKVMTNLVDIMPEFGVPADELKMITDELAPILAEFAEIQLFDAERALVITCEVDENNLCTGMNLELNLDLNIYDIIEKFSPESIEGENRDDWGIKLGIAADMQFEELPEDYAVVYPILNPENCGNFISFYNENVYDETDYETPITVNCNGAEIVFDEPPVLFRNRTMVPIRALANAIGITDENILYEEETEKIVLKGEAKEIVMYVGSQYAYLNGDLKTFDVPAIENNGRAYIPARAISEFFGKTVDYTDLAENGGFGLIVEIND